MALKTKQGFIESEVGLIPEDWKCIRIGDSLDFKNGLNKESKYFGYGTPIINYMDVFNHFGIKKKDITGKVFLSAAEKQNFSAKEGDVFFTRTSETQEEIGTSAVLMEDINECVFSGFVLRGRPKNSFVTKEYYQYCLTPLFVRKQIISTSSYTTRALTNGRFLSAVHIAVPKNKEEQKTIATALSDIDGLITNLDKLIAKKKNIKKGAMQQLLAPPNKGGKRLPGFSGDWEEKIFSNFLIFNKGEQLNRSTLDDQNDYPVINGGIEPSGYTSEWNSEKDSITISEGGNSCGYVNKINTRFWSGGHCYTLQFNRDKLDADFLYHLLKYRERDIMALRVGSGLPNIQKARLYEFKIHLPKQLKEQNEIAVIFNDLTDEINQLEIKKSKLTSVKQGMMQELLTGKTRLI